MGKRDLFWELLEPEYRKAEAFCRRLTGNRDEADDLLQDALVKAIKRFGSLRDHRAFISWLFRIIVNTFKSRQRSSKNSPAASFEEDRSEPSPSADPSAYLSARRQLEKALEALKPNERALVILYELEGWSVNELSGMFGRPEGTIKSKIARARKKMRKEIEKSILNEVEFKSQIRGAICVAAKQNVE